MAFDLTSLTKKPDGQSGFLAPIPTTIDSKNPLNLVNQLGETQIGLNLANAQLSTNLNRYNTSGPLSSSSWSQNPDGTFKYSTQLTPEQQKLLNQSQGNQSQIGGMVGAYANAAAKPFAIPTMDQGYMDKVVNANYNRQTSAMDPKFAQDEAAMKQDLEQRKIPVGSELYNTMLSNFTRGKTDAYTNAMDLSVASGADAASKYYDMQLQSAQLPLLQLGKIASTYQGLNGTTQGALGASAQSSNSPIDLQSTDLMGAGMDVLGMENSKQISAGNNKASVASSSISANAQLEAARLADARLREQMASDQDYRNWMIVNGKG